ncbi:MAG: S-layer homology domain-containing protein [Clostridia bacterium]|nr:S-layer homology domain-containing protein [Clostridia bacterium]
MKKLLSAVTALSVITVSISAQAFTLRLPRVFDDVIGIAVTDTEAPTAAPTIKPTDPPTAAPTIKPTEAPTAAPTIKPTEAPTAAPTAIPTIEPTDAPTAAPTIKPTEVPDICKSITLNKQSLNLKRGESFKLTAVTEPAGLEEISWRSSDESVLVTDDGTVWGVKEGEAIVSAMTNGSRLIASCFISVVADDGIITLSVTEGVKEVVVTLEGLSTEVRAGDNTLEAGTYTVSAKAEANYTLGSFSETVTVKKNEKTPLVISAARTKYTVTKPEVTGVTVTAVGGSTETVEPGGSYSFTVATGASYDASKLTVKANGSVLTAKDGVYTISNINDDIIITIDGVESKSWDATLKSVTVAGSEATLGANNEYVATIPYGETVKASDIKVTVNDIKASYTITTIDGVFNITVKAEDGTTVVYKLTIKNAEATPIDSVKVALNSTLFADVTQNSGGSYKTQDEAKEYIKTKLDNLIDTYPGVSYTIENGESKRPVKGTIYSPGGEDGYYKYKVTLTSGSEIRVCEVVIAIIGYDFVISSSNITATATTITVKNVDSSVELALFTEQGGKLRKWTTPSNNSVTFSNLASDSTYTVKIRAAGTDDVPSVGTNVTTLYSSTTSRGASSYHTVYFDVGDHGTIVEGKAKQTVGNTRVADYPTVKADNGYIFKGWSSNGVLIENPKTYYIRSTTTFIAVYEEASGSSYSSSKSTNYGTDTALRNTATQTVARTLFSDVPEGSWYYNSVNKMYTQGYMNGVTETEFAPEGTLTRAMLVTILYRYACEPNVYSGNGFGDVPDGTWYTDAVTWASDAGIVNGVSNGTFAPNDNITREQLAAILFRYSEAFGYDTSASGNIINYSDSAYISDWAQTALIWTTGAGIITGKDNNRLDPKGNATRAEAATMIERFDDLIDTEL